MKKILLITLCFSYISSFYVFADGGLSVKTYPFDIGPYSAPLTNIKILKTNKGDNFIFGFCRKDTRNIDSYIFGFDKDKGVFKTIKKNESSYINLGNICTTHNKKFAYYIDSSSNIFKINPNSKNLIKDTGIHPENLTIYFNNSLTITNDNKLYFISCTFDVKTETFYDNLNVSRIGDDGNLTPPKTIKRINGNFSWNDQCHVTSHKDNLYILITNDMGSKTHLFIVNRKNSQIEKIIEYDTSNINFIFCDSFVYFDGSLFLGCIRYLPNSLNKYCAGKIDLNSGKLEPLLLNDYHECSFGIYNRNLYAVFSTSSPKELTCLYKFNVNSKKFDLIYINKEFTLTGNYNLTVFDNNIYSFEYLKGNYILFNYIFPKNIESNI